jgi:phosphoribosylglycinamide formyltransferase 2
MSNPGSRSRCAQSAASARSEIAAAVTGNLGGRGVFGVELFVQGRRRLVLRGQPASARHRHGHADARSAQSEFELHARAILGLPVDVALREPGAPPR